MRFTNFDRSYQVMRYLDGTEKTEEYLCTELTGREHTACLLVRVTDVVLARHLLLFLEEKVKDGEFTDYRECFQADGALLAVFRYSREQSLFERLGTERCGRRERAEIARRLLERLLLLKPHPYLACSGLLPKQITVDRGLEVKLNYHLTNLEQLEQYSMQEVCLQLKQVFSLLFEEEEKKKLYPKLGEYMQRLEKEPEEGYEGLYQTFMPAYEELMQEEIHRPVPKTVGFRIWERAKGLLKIGQRILAAVIILAAIVYVIRSLQSDGSAQVMSRSISQIGELTIESGEIPQQENGE